MKKSKCLEDIFPIEFIEAKKAISKNGSISMGFEFTALPSKETLSRELYEGFQFTFCEALNVLTPGCLVQKMDIFYHQPYLPNSEPEDYLTKRKTNFFYYRPLLKQRSILFLTITPYQAGFNASQTFFSRGKSRFSKLLNKEDETFDRLEALGSQFLNIISQLEGIQLQRMGDIELERFYYQYLNLDFSPSTFDGLHKSIYNEKSGAIIGSEYLNIISMVGQGSEVFSSLPQLHGVHAPFLDPLLSDLKFPHILNQCIKICNTEQELSKLDTLRNLVSSFTRPGDQAGEIHESGLSELSREVRQNGGGLVHFHFNIMVFEADKGSLVHKLDTVIAKISSLGGTKSMVENFDTTNLFFSMVGGNLQENFRWILMPTRNASCYFHFTGPFLGDKNGLLLCNRNREPIFVDFWKEDLENKNKIVIGPSGSGKSFAVNTLITQHVSNNEEVIILDIGGSYKGLFRILNGNYIEYNSLSSLSFNPFLLSQSAIGVYLLNQEKINFLITLLTILWKGENHPISLIEKSILGRLVTHYYQFLNKKVERNIEVFPSLDDFYHFLKGFLNDFNIHHKLDGELNYLDLRELLIVLFNFTLEGNYPLLLNSSNRLRLSESSLICFDLQGIKEDKTIFPVISLLIIELVLDKFSDYPLGRKHIYMDEAWSMLQNALGDFVMNMFRTIRKSNGAVTIITQGIDEIERSPFGKAILQNTSTKILLDHNSTAQYFPVLQNTLGLTEHEMILLKSLRKNESEGWREIFIKMGNKAFVFVIEPSPEEKIAFDSRSESRNKLEKLMHKYNSNYALAIDQYLEEGRANDSSK